MAVMADMGLPVFDMDISWWQKKERASVALKSKPRKKKFKKVPDYKNNCVRTVEI